MKPPEIKRLPIIQYHDLVIDPQCHTVALSGEEVILFPKEFNVLLLLAHYPGWVLTPTQIYTSIWHEDPIDCNHMNVLEVALDVLAIFNIEDTCDGPVHTMVHHNVENGSA